ncbi:hypothetical protein BKA70DRAFT_1412909 [Coprinopsis sp. MPI-PUGE-AT-0042]|nr:hypothetical protein BKA70DRAFT_1412909 [Coprinopsis sp. MPI-PUGE-AT-0042]
MSSSTNLNARARNREPCRLYRQGKCTKGDTCRYLHTRAAPISAAQQSPLLAVNLGLSNGPTAAGPAKKSRRRRGRGGASGSQPASITQANGGPGKRKKPCFAFRDGSCTKGASCTYSHDPKIRQDEIRRLQAIAEEEEAGRRREEDRSRREGEERRRREEAEEAHRREQERLQRVREREARERQRVQAEREARERAQRELAERQKRQREAAIAEAERRRAERERRNREMEERAARERAEIERIRQEREARETRERAQRELVERRKRQREAAATLQVVVGGSNPAGFETRSIIPGFDLCAVVVRKFPSDATKENVTHVFRRELGLQDNQFYVADVVLDDGTKKATILTQIENTKDIEGRALEGITFRDRYLEFELGANAMWGKMNASGGGEDPDTLTIQWSGPSKTMILTYSTMEEARRKTRDMDGTVLHGRRVRAALNTRPTGPAAPRSFVPESVKVTNVDMTVQAWELSAVGGTYRIQEVKSAVTYDLQDCIRILEARLQLYGAVFASFKTTPLEGNRMQAKARFASNEAAQRAFAAIEEGSFGQTPPFRAFLPKGHQFTISIGRQQYDSQRTLWDDLAEGSNSNGAFVRVNERKNNRRMYIEVLGSNQREVGALKVRVENLVVGESLASEYWHSSFLGAAGNALLKKIKDTTAASITIDRRVQALRLFGTGPSKLATKEVIQEEVERLNFLEWSIPLQRQSVAFFVRLGLKSLQDAIGEENVSLNLSSQPATIKIKGGDDARHHLRKLMDEATELIQSGLTIPQRTAGGGTCPICYDEVSSPDTLSCGHSYCEGCLRHYLISAADSKTFPLVCMGEEATCGRPVAIPIIQRYLTASRMNRLVDAAFLAYLEQNPRTFKYCPTPDCSQIYRCDNTKDFHQCPSCFFKICGRCNEEAHNGIGCEDARIQRNPAEQERLNEEWAQRNNARRCPECRIMIIKGEGCNHVECRCGAHICWRCLGVFSRVNIYGHMQTAHGGIYEPEPAAPAAPVIPPQPPVTVANNAQRLQAAAAAQEEADRRYAQRLQAEQYGAGRLEREAAQERARQLLQVRQRENEERERIREEMARTQRELNAREEARRRALTTQVATPATRESEGGWCTIM